jgi:prevent-host-death family protein
MNRHVNMLEAKTQLSKLVEAVESGAESEIIIARNGKPAAKLVPIKKPKRTVQLGLAEGKYAVLTQEEFDADNDAIWKEWNEKPLFADESQ